MSGTTTKERYSDDDLAEFKSLILNKIENAQHQLELYEDAYKNGSFL